MPDRRTVDELTIEELEQILAIRRAEARAARIRRLRAIGRVSHSMPEAEAEDGGAVRVASVESGRRFGGWKTVAEPAPQTPRARRRTPRSRMARLRERALLALEVAALVGLVVVLAGALTSLRALNEEASQASALPQSVPTVSVADDYLPSGHTPPGSTGGSVPVHLRDRVQAAPQVAVPVPTPGPQAPTRIVVPALRVDAVVVEGDDWEQLKLGVGHHLNTANPGERGNLVLSAHNDIYGQIFRYLNRLELEDEIIVYAGEQMFTYRVKAKRIVEPTEVSVMAPTTRPVVTLISCYPYLVDSHRIVVIGELD